MVFRILRPDSNVIWQNKEILKRFSRYRGIIDGKQLARYLVAKTIECDYNSSDSIEKLEILLKEKSLEFNELLKKDIEEIKSRKTSSNSYIHLAENMGEEAPLIPSGTIFFQGCNFGCVFCQNYDISQAWKERKELDDIAQKINVKSLAAVAEKLAKRGALNINYVGGDPIPNIHTIVGSLNLQTTNITQLWNSNFYLSDRALSLIIDLIDFWLPDFKYGNNKCGKKYSGVENYFDFVARNHKRVHDEGSGEIIIRHLVMPGHIECCSLPILDYIAKDLPKAVVNIMGQYRPQYHSFNYPEINRSPTSQEMQDVKNYASHLGILYEPVS
ncbi:MAG: radical SAM protein [Promethearchaeota archaeon]|jgi:putative pyruvate formate lyase activating enzyme